MTFLRNFVHNLHDSAYNEDFQSAALIDGRMANKTPASFTNRYLPGYYNF